jgi:hypothetical protein
MLAAAECIDVIPTVHADGGDIAEFIAVGQRAPAVMRLIEQRPRADRCGHFILLSMGSIGQAERDAGGRGRGRLISVENRLL